MFRCRLIRTVVNLLLIVAMTIQPGIASVYANDCEEKCASAHMCEGCGCCEVSSPAEKCCCCSSGLEKDDRDSCCMGSSESATQEALASDAIEIKVIVISTDDTVVSDASDERHSDIVTSACLCGFESQPVGDPTPSRPTIERRDSVKVRFSDLAIIFGEATRRPRHNIANEDLSLAPHFSQIQLCIWRL